MRLRGLLVLTALIGCTPAPGTQTAAPAPAIVGISAAELRTDLFAFSADSFLGRETGTRAGMSASRFIAERLMTLGVEPAGDSLYYQRVPLVRQSVGSGTRIGVEQGGSTTTLALGSEIVPFVNLGPGAPLPRRNAEGDLVFAGYGMNTNGRDDFRGINQAGKVIVMVHAAPPGITDSTLRKRLDSQEELQGRLIRALQLQPAAIILLTHAGTSEFYTQAAPELMRSMTPAPGDQTTSDAERPLPMILLGAARPGSPLLPPNWPDDNAPRALEGRRFSASVELRMDPVTAYNVVGVVRGTDPRLNKSYVAYGAHHDHIGVQTGMAPDSIANGADDDGSGSVMMLALAKAFAANRPRRSTLFVWHTAEEKGLFGSAHYVNHPTVPIDSIVAMINMDMVGRRGGPTAEFDSRTSGAQAENRVYVVGPAAAPNNQSRRLGAVLDEVNARQVRPLTLDREWDSPDHPERIYFRSDHFHYASKGIPILFLTTGLHEDYHKVSDEPGKIDYPKMARIGNLLLELGATLANQEQRPR